MVNRIRTARGPAASGTCSVLGHIDGAEVQYERLGIGRSKSVAAGAPAGGASSWHSTFGSSFGLFVVTGAVRPLVGSCCVNPQVADMERHGFKAHWSELQIPGFMRGVVRGAQRLVIRCH